jgi:hypothetical protein
VSTRLVRVRAAAGCRACIEHEESEVTLTGEAEASHRRTLGTSTSRLLPCSLLGFAATLAKVSVVLLILTNLV